MPLTGSHADPRATRWPPYFSFLPPLPPDPSPRPPPSPSPPGQARIRCFIRRVRYKMALAALRAWRSRELSEVAAPLMAWLRRREDLQGRLDELRNKWCVAHSTRLVRPLFIDGMHAPAPRLSDRVLLRRASRIACSWAAPLPLMAGTWRT